MKVLHLANFYHEQSGGIKTYLDNKRKFYNDKGIPFRMIIPGDIDTIEEYPQGDRIYRVSAPRTHLAPLYRMIMDLKSIGDIIKLEKPDIVEINDKYTLAAAGWIQRQIRKEALTVGFHHERLDENIRIYFPNSKIMEWLAKQFMKAVGSCFDKVICASQQTAGEITVFAPEKVEIINLGTNTELFSSQQFDPQLNKEMSHGADKVIFYAGRLAKEKNLALLPDMMEILKNRGINAHLVCAGVGPDEHLITDHQRDDITLLGFISGREKMAAMYASADVFVFPSIKEPFGLAPLEALAAGLPVVSSNQGGVMEYSGTEAMKNVEPVPVKFAEAVVDLLSQDRSEYGNIAKAHAQKFSWDVTFENQLSFYESLFSSANIVR